MKIFILILAPFFCYSQKTNESDNFRDSINSNIFRIVITRNTPNSISLQYERRIRNSFTFLVETGPTVDIKTFGNIEDPTKSKYQFSISFFGSLETRYFFNLKHRIKKGKPVHNFSAFYISLQEYLLSNPVILINQKASQAFQGNIQTFLNVGWQKQFKSYYFHVFAGPSLARKTFSKYFLDQYINKFQVGLSFGFAF